MHVDNGEEPGGNFMSRDTVISLLQHLGFAINLKKKIPV